MKKQFTITAVSLICIGSTSAQSLFDLAPSNDDSEPLPLTWTAGASVGFDDNAAPFFIGEDQSSLFGSAYVGASFLSRTPATTTEFFARLGVVHYFDDIEVGGLSADQSSEVAGFGLNWTNRISDRLRIVSRNNLNKQREPDYAQGFQGSVSGDYLRWSTDQAVGYRWSERLGTYTGVRYDDVSYDDIDGFDRSSLTFYNDFRYQLSPQTVATFTYRHTEVDGGLESDSTNSYFLVGLEHRFSPNTLGVIKAGVQNRDVDGGGEGSSPYVEASLRSQINEQFAISSYLRYGVEDYARRIVLGGIGAIPFEGSETLRLGLTGTYGLSEQLSLNAGVNYVSLGYVDSFLAGLPDVDEESLNLSVGFRLELSDTMWLDGSYNFETLSSDIGSIREYDRNRINLGINTTF
ncbi:MAG: outer membrane beta-barrel protein [Akkermansiaceae bacterium]|nr:outer membrane beta-barrel protein [Akkermansiaceae bacterium]